MNKWKIAFFLLLVVIIGSISAFIYWITAPADYVEEPVESEAFTSGHVLTVNATKEDFEGIANSFIQKAMDGKPLPLQLEVDDQIVLTSELTIFSLTLPVKMNFDPYVEENGNIRLEQSSVEVGELQIPPETVLKLLRDSIDLPPWMIVKPQDEEVLLQLTSIPIASGVNVRAKELDLEVDKIILEIVVPTK